MLIIYKMSAIYKKLKYAKNCFKTQSEKKQLFASDNLQIINLKLTRKILDPSKNRVLKL